MREHLLQAYYIQAEEHCKIPFPYRCIKRIEGIETSILGIKDGIVPAFFLPYQFFRYRLNRCYMPPEGVKKKGNQPCAVALNFYLLFALSMLGHF